MTTVDVPRSSRSRVLTVSGVVEETADALSLVFEVPEHLRSEFAYKPGQFLTLRIPSERTGFVARCYSLASSPFTDDLPKVTVKRTATGYGSNWVCDNVRIGDSLEVLPPAGAFTPQSLDENLLLFAGGSGVTPVISILKSALAQGNGNLVLFYANRDERSIIFATELRDLAAKHPDRLLVIHWLESSEGLPTAERLAAVIAPFGDYRAFMCGPAPFMTSVHEALAAIGVPRNRIHAEVFNSLAGDPFAHVALALSEEVDETDSATVEIGLDGETHCMRWPRRQTLVDVMIARGLNVPYSCREGECGSCACTVLEGKVTMDKSDILDPDDIDKGYILGCQSRPATDYIKIEF